VTQFSVPWKAESEPVDYRVGRFVGLWTLIGVASCVFVRVILGLAGAPGPVLTLFGVVCPIVVVAGALATLFVVNTWRVWGRVLFRVAGIVLLGAVVATCVGVFLTYVLLEWVTTDLVASEANGPQQTWFGGGVTIPEIAAALPAAVPEWVSCLIWPFQFPAGRDLLGFAAIFGFILVIPVYLIWWERKVSARIQSRLGLMRVGGWHGWAQSPADGTKLLLKEDLIPAGADKPLFRLAPYLAFVPVPVAFAALPFGAAYVFRELDVALVFILAILGIEVVGVIIAGWASNNKWSVYGSMREACQMVSYEIPMGLALLLPVVAAGSLNLTAIADDQAGGWWSWMLFRNPFLFVGFAAYYIASLANCKRAPFDLPESESELVAGFHTEYSGFRWCLFFFAEYAAMYVVSGLAVILYLGAWQSPFGPYPGNWIAGFFDNPGPVGQLFIRGMKGVLESGPVWFVLKCVFLLYVQLWLRWTLPRIRIDQVLYACVQVLLPLTMVLLIGNAIWVWADTSTSIGWAWVTGAFNVLLGIIGLVFAVGFIVIAAYGFYYRRKLIGVLAIDPLPGS